MGVEGTEYKISSKFRHWRAFLMFIINKKRRVGQCTRGRFNMCIVSKKGGEGCTPPGSASDLSLFLGKIHVCWKVNQSC